MRVGLGKRLRHPALWVAVPIIVVGLVGTAVAVSNRSADSLFVYRQQNLSAVKPQSLAHLVSLAPNPRPGLGRPKATSATCSPQGTGELRNPWLCVVHYTRGSPVHYTATISLTGNVVAVDPTGQLVVRGCCVGSHPTQ
ncbi:MAG: hypothetical protein ACJ764_08590 [Solirubrobacteraceae bacterium]